MDKLKELLNNIKYKRKAMDELKFGDEVRIEIYPYLEFSNSPSVAKTETKYGVYLENDEFVVSNKGPEIEKFKEKIDGFSYIFYKKIF